MKKMFDFVFDREGNAVTGAEVYVRKQSDNTLVTLYSDNGVTTKANPTITDSDGEFSFYTADNTLKLQVYVGGVQQNEIDNLQHYDVGAITTFGWSLIDDANAAAARTTLGAAASGANTDLTSVYLNNTGLKIKDTNASHGLTIAPGSDLTADRTLTITTGDAARTLDISAANVTVSSFAATLLDDADAAAARTTLGVTGAGAITASGLTMATSRLLGRTTASSGAIEEISVGSGLSLASGTISRFGAGTFRGALVTKAADQTAANYTSNTAIAWDSEVYDTDTVHDNVTNNTRLSVPSGVTKVRLQAQIHATNMTAGESFTVRLGKNGTVDDFTGAPSMTDSGGNTRRVNIHSPVLNVTGGTDYFELFLIVGTDTSITINATTSWFALEILE